MAQRVNYQQQSPDLYRKFAAFSTQIEHSQIDATLRQFPTIRAVRLIGSTGRCLFDLSGQDRCSGPAVQPHPGG